MSGDPDVVIIGAGHNALVAAVYLARAGLSVDLFEARGRAGGACLTEELAPGEHFSTCAHILHGLHPRIVRDLDLVRRGLVVLPRSFGIHLREDDAYWAPESVASPRNLSRSLSGEERAGVRDYLGFRESLTRILAPYRLRPPPTLTELARSAADPAEALLLDKASKTRFLALQDALLPTSRLKDRYGGDRAFVARDPLALSFASECINAPDEATGEPMLSGYVKGGMGVVARLMLEAAGEAGARVHLRRRVERILTERGRALGLRLADGTEIRARIVISGLDPKQTFLSLLTEEAVTPQLRASVSGLKSAVSCYKFLAVLSELPVWKAWDGDPAAPGAGGVAIGYSRGEVAAAYDDLESGRPPREPLVSFSIPSVVDPSQTRPGYHTASVWVLPAPSRLEGESWVDAKESVAERLIDQITRYAPNFRRSIVRYWLRTPLDIARMHGMTDGCIWHIQHEGEQMLANRPLPELSAYRGHLEGLYLCGSGQHPGGEVTGMPGHNAAAVVLRDVAARPR